MCFLEDLRQNLSPIFLLYGLHQWALPYHTENSYVLRMMTNMLSPKIYEVSQ